MFTNEQILDTISDGMKMLNKFMNAKFATNNVLNDDDENPLVYYREQNVSEAGKTNR